MLKSNVCYLGYFLSHLHILGSSERKRVTAFGLLSKESHWQTSESPVEGHHGD